MNAIIGFTGLLENSLDDKEKSLKYIKKIQTSNSFLLSLINNVLEMARIESGKLVLELSYWNVWAFNDSIYSSFSVAMEKKNIEFTREVNVEHTDVLCDTTKVREIFLNLLGNAMKYTPVGGKVSMNLTEIPSKRDGYAYYQTVIEDTGIGMAPEYVEHIFDAFSRERTSTESRVEGSGLGMSIVKRLIDLMEGTISVESQVGQGTKITVVIPHKIASDEDKPKFDSQNTELDGKMFAGRRILLAEDNDFNAEIAVSLLEDAGFIVEHAEDGAICVSMVQNAEANYYDLILMDIQMPNLNGYEATDRIRSMKDEAKANIPIVAMTANAFEEDKQNAARAGMNYHLAKPVKVDELLKTLSKIL